jgi:GT2 family glycosyltransferase
VEDVEEALADDARVASDEDSAPADTSSTVAGPSVLAVVVAHDPGDWFDDVLESLAAQDYPRLTVMVINTTSTDIAPRVHHVLPAATLLAATTNDTGYGATANRVLTEGPRAALLLLCHDDVALAPNAVTHLVDEVIRSNAAIVAPKLVMWDDPTRLQHVGLSVDKFGASAPLADEGEIDQAQRDAVTDVFAVPSACILVRADLFRTLGGFDPEMRFRGDDVDLCWRAQLAGARVMVVPDAVARHRERLADRRVLDDTSRLQLRHANRSMLSCWGIGRLARILPQALVLTLVEIIYALAHGRFRHARELAAAWTWNLRRLPGIHRRRKAIAAYRQTSDADVHRLQVRGSARLRMYFRGQLGRDDERMISLTSASRELASSLRTAATRQSVVGIGLLIFVLLVGSRHFFSGAIPAVGELQPLRGGGHDLFEQWWRGWNTRALGSDAAPPTAYGMLALASVPLLGHVALLRTVLVVLPLPLAGLGMWRLTRPFGSRRANLTGVVVYLAVPVAYNGYAQGSLSALAVFAAAPWLLGAFGRLVGTAPFAPAGRRGGSFAHRVMALAVLVAITVAFVPFAAIVMLVVMAGVLVGSLVTGDGRGLGRLLAGTVGAAALVFVLHLPWSLTFLGHDRSWASVAGAGSFDNDGYGIGDILRFHTGPFGSHPVSFAVLAAAGFPLLLAQGERLAWAVRGWFVALVCWALVLAGQQDWLGRGLPDPGVLLAPAAAGLALASALGIAAFEIDLRRHRFGWRQFAPFAAVAAIGLLLVPFATGAADGRWKMPRRDFSRSYDALVAHPEDGEPRVLWIGDSRVLPLGGLDLAQNDLTDAAAGLAFATTDGQPPSLLDRWGGPETAGAQLVRDAISRAVAGDTNRLGALLSVLAIRYVVLTDHLVPAPYAGDVRPVPEALHRAFEAQLDLERVESVNDALTVYRNNSWSPIRAVLPAGVDLTVNPFEQSRGVPELEGAKPALSSTSADGVEASGPLVAGDDLYLSANASSRWHLAVNGTDAARATGFGWANSFESPTSGQATLTYRTPLSRHLALLANVVVWVLVIGFLNALRERRRRA